MTISSRRLGSAKDSKVKVKAEDDDVEEEQTAKAADLGKKAADLSVGMVHGDVLVLTNDVYQVSGEMRIHIFYTFGLGLARYS